MGIRLKGIKYSNLLAEMKRHGETQYDIAKLLNLNKATVNIKLQGKRDWNISEIKVICDHYKMGYDELFQ